MKSKFNIITYINLDYLNNEIEKFENNNQYSPIILTSIDTIRNFPDYNERNFKFKNQFDDYDYINMYMGCKIFIDNTLKFGEIELR